MKQYIITKNDSGQRLNKFLEKTVPRLTLGMLHKYCRSKRIKINNSRTEASYKLNEGDILQLYINDEFFEAIEKVKPEEAFRKIENPNLKIVFEDKNIILVDKEPGIVVHADNQGDTNTLIAHIQAHLFQSGEWNPDDAYSFAPALCNRIDRNTGGIVIAAKTAEALRIMNDKIKNHEIKKKYLCIVHDRPSPASGKIDTFLRKDDKLNMVTVHKNRLPGAKTALTMYRTLTFRANLSLVECELITGRTHQIRAHMASIGNPLLGDGKYGLNEKNKPYNENGQLLYSYKLRFDFTTPSGVLDYLNGCEFTARQVPFVKKYFPLHRMG